MCFYELCTADYYKFRDVKHQRSLFWTRIHLEFQAHVHVQLANSCAHGNAKCGPGFLATAAAKINFAAATADMAEGGLDNGEFIANSCIQLRMYAHVLLYFIPLLHRNLHGNGSDGFNVPPTGPTGRHEPFKCCM